MKYAFFSGCGVGGSPGNIRVLSHALTTASAHGAIPVIVGDLFVAPSVQVTRTSEVIEALRLVTTEACRVIAGTGDTTTPGFASGPAAFLHPDFIGLRSYHSADLDAAFVAADGTDWEETIVKTAQLIPGSLVLAVLPRGTALERVASVMAGSGSELIVVGGQTLPGELEALGGTVISVGTLCPSGFDGSGFNAGKILIYDRDEDVYDWEQVDGPRYHVVKSLAQLRSVITTVYGIAPDCHHYIQLRVQPGDTDTSEAVAREYVRELTVQNIAVTLTVTPDLAATRAEAIKAATTLYRGATHVEAVDAWFRENPSQPEVRARVEAYLGIGGAPCT